MADPKQPQKPYDPHLPGSGRPGDEQRERQNPRPDPQRREPNPEDQRHKPREGERAPQRQ
jgi:hypothetical protein